MDNFIDELGRNCLHMAATEGKNFLVAKLIRAGLNVNRQTIYGFTPLHLACSWSHESTALLLLDMGADARIVDRHGRNAIFMGSEGIRDRLIPHPMVRLRFSVAELETFKGDNAVNKTKALTERYNIRLFAVAAKAEKVQRELEEEEERKRRAEAGLDEPSAENGGAAAPEEAKSEEKMPEPETPKDWETMAKGKARQNEKQAKAKNAKPAKGKKGKKK